MNPRFGICIWGRSLGNYQYESTKSELCAGISAATNLPCLKTFKIPFGKLIKSYLFVS